MTPILTMSLKKYIKIFEIVIAFFVNFLTFLVAAPGLVLPSPDMLVSSIRKVVLDIKF